MSLPALVKMQEDIYGRLSRSMINFKKSPKERLTYEYISTRLENVEDLWSNFNANHSEIVKNADTEALLISPYTTKELYFTTEELYLDLKCELKVALCKVNRSDSTQVVDVVTRNVSENKNINCVKLPRIIIPKFSGKYTEWPTFRDLFVSAIHKNSTLDNVQKLHYLKGYLSGEPEQLLRHIAISDLNYNRCWDLLVSRYNNKKFLSHSVLNRLLGQKSITNQSAAALKDLVDTTTDCLNALTNLDINVSSWDILIIHILTLKLDQETRKEWEIRVTSCKDVDKLPTYEEFKDFLTSRYRAFEFIEPKLNKNVNVNANRHSSFHNAMLLCQYCRDEHKIFNCKQFLDQDVDMRRKFVQENNLCFNCLGQNHSVKSCRSAISCRICKRQHHTLLHPKSNGEPSGGKGESTSSNVRISQAKEFTHMVEVGNETEVVTCFSKGSSNNQILLATALLQAESKTGNRYTIRALLDQGSQASFVTEDVVQSLGLRKQSAKGIIFGVGGGNKIISNSLVEVKIQSKVDSTYELVVKAYVLKSITSLLPSRETICLDWLQVNEIQLADPRYHTPDKVDMLLGAEVYTKVIQNGLKKSPNDSIVAQRTTLGWILSGTIGSASDYSSNITMLHVHVHDADELLKKFWELEKEPNENKKHPLTNDEIKCEQIFKNTTFRDKNGRYVVNLPFRNDDPGCKYGNSRDIAIKRFYALENRLNRDKEVKTQYAEVIHEYLTLGHMKLISAMDKLNNQAVYLPHHAVIRNDRETTKLRVVFDASCKGSNGISLNDDLLIGPTLQPDLRHLLLRWRIHPICLISDVVKMYRQIYVTNDHPDFQRIVWRDTKESEIQDYKLLTVTFGTASAPFLAVRSLQQLAYDEGESYPLAAKRVLNDYYMDDLMTGCETISDGIEIYRQMNKLLSKAGLELQKWSSNSDELLEAIKGNHNIKKGIMIKQDEIIKTLGLTWNRKEDTFQYSVQLQTLEEPITKRKILSDISKLFDPLGWVAPVVVIAKVLIQKLWVTGIGWDEVIPNEIKNEWFTYRQQLQCLTEFSIPRWLNSKQSDKQIELHGFCDASKTAYAAVVYARVIDSEDGVHVTLLTAKSNVAPIKTISIPRLELCGAVLLAKLLQEVSRVMEIDKSNLYAWTDSEIVLAWINSHPNRWKTFVANRVSEILYISEPHQWNHVPSKQNPADCASRGLHPSELLASRLWLEGPEFLRQNKIPLVRRKNVSTTVDEIKVNNIVSVKHDNWIWDKYSSLTRLIRIIAYCRRVCEWRKPIEQRHKSYLSAAEIKLALDVCIRECQKQSFQEELLLLQGTAKNKRTPLSSLNPYLDSANILRVGGRLDQSDLDMNRKHPILIPRVSPLTNLLIADAHRLTLHGGIQLMLNYLSNQYYIIGVKTLIRSYVRKCVTCIRYNASTKPQLMGQLPSSRVIPGRPFKSSGVDYAGPINLRTSKGRGHRSYKGYICLFICMVTKAIHLEVVSDLTTEGFLAAFKRFVARRGRCKDIWSDNGTNFQGASKELQILVRSETSGIAKEIAETLANQGTSWHYIPPHAPNFGGLWEAGIKSCKQHLRRVIGNSTLTYEEMTTLLTQIEACLNSRPLYRLTDSNSIDALTPGHFLVGEPIINAADHNYETTNISSLKRWHLVQKMMQVFWRRWSNEYLTTLLHRYKWSQQTPEPSIGDIVLVKEDNLPPSRWLLGRVMEKHPGQDNLTRVVTLRTSASTIKRPTSKLCVLPIG